MRPVAFAFIVAAFGLTITAVISGSNGDSDTAHELTAAIRKLEPIHQKMGKPKPGDWLSEHKEAGQTFAEYLKSNPVTPQGKRNTIYIQPIGEFSETQRKVLNLTTEYMELYFGIPVKTMEVMPLSSIPDRAKRVHPSWGDRQILTTYVLRNILKPNLPPDAAASIAFSSSDLWPGKGWNFVFGQASLRERVGVWSIYRNGNPDTSKAGFALCLRRTIKTAVHETGHMFSMKHCIAYECCMCGSNHREESDRRPLYLCPECNAKICWATRSDPVERYTRLLDFCQKHGMEAETKYYRKALQTLKQSTTAILP